MVKNMKQDSGLQKYCSNYDSCEYKKLDNLASNFDFMKEEFPDLALLGKRAELYCLSDPDSCLYKLGKIGEQIVKRIFRKKLNTLYSDKDTHYDRIETLRKKKIIGKDNANVLHELRMARNDAVHKNFLRNC